MISLFGSLVMFGLLLQRTCQSAAQSVGAERGPDGFLSHGRASGICQMREPLLAGNHDKAPMLGE